MQKILYVTPHLSTGGAPQYLLKKIELLNDQYDIYVAEYNDYGIFRVQKDEIITLLGKKHKTISERREELLEWIDEISPDIIHFEEMPELFNIEDEIATKIYSKDRPYKIFETSHDSSFDLKLKKYFPDKFLFCSDNQLIKFRSIDVPACVIEYPVKKYKRKNRVEGLKYLNLDPEYKHVLNVGLFTSRKNQAEIFEYAKHLINEKIQFHFIGNQAPNFKDYSGTMSSTSYIAKLDSDVGEEYLIEDNAIVLDSTSEIYWPPVGSGSDRCSVSRCAIWQGNIPPGQIITLVVNYDVLGTSFTWWGGNRTFSSLS